MSKNRLPPAMQPFERNPWTWIALVVLLLVLVGLWCGLRALWWLL